LCTTAVSSREYMAWLFGWDREDADRAAGDVVEAGEAEPISVRGWEGEYLTDKRSALLALGG